MKPRITIIGLGRLGTSIGFALKKSGAELEIIGHDKVRDVGNAAQKAGAVDRHDWNLYNACDGAGMIVLSMPLAGVLETIELLKNDVAPGVIVTDTAAVKVPVIEAARVFKPGVHFVGGHPIFRPKLDGAPSNATGDAELFRDADYCLTPTPETDADAVQVLTGYISMLGAKPLYLDVAEHDGLAAGAQQLAILMQAAFLQTTTSSSGWRELNKFAGDAYFRATELAAGDANSTAQELRIQQAPLQLWIDQAMQTLREFKTQLAQPDGAALEKTFKTMQMAREQWLANQVGTSTQAVDMSEVRSGATRMFLGGLATRLGGNKKK